MPATDEYKMALDLVALRHLGIGLHGGVPDVLSEAVANAWDADAGRVDISIGGGRIAVKDDGCGMTVADANEKYLRVGYERRREGGGRTPKKGRLVMGRNGIGNLSPFSIADTVTVHSARGGERHGFVMCVRDMEDSARRGEPYRPEPIDAAPDLESGTRITLSGLRCAIYDAPLRRGLARRFSVIGGCGFEVAVNGDLIGAADRGCREGLQYVWNFGGDGSRGATAGRGDPRVFSEASIALGGGTVQLRGWIGTAHRPGQLRDADTGEILNRITVMARGREVQEDMLGDLAMDGMWCRCVVGEIHADFLDTDNEEDIVAAGRRRIRGDAPRYEALRAAVKRTLVAVEQKWNGLRGEDGTKLAREIPEIDRWYEALGPDHKRTAENLFGRINRVPVDNEGDRRRLLIGGVLAFESLGARDVLDMLGRAGAGGGESMDTLRDVVTRLDDFDASAYYQTAKIRLGLIDNLVDATGDDDLAKVDREHLLDRLWILDPSWERAAGTGRIEAEVRRALEAVAAGEKGEEALQCIRYRAAAGKHIVIDLKEPGARIGTGNLVAQISKYEEAMRRVLDKHGRGGEPVEFVCVVGVDLVDWNDAGSRDRSQKALAAYSARIVTYGELVGGARESYRRHIGGRNGASRMYDFIMDIREGDQRLMRPSG